MNREEIAQKVAKKFVTKRVEKWAIQWTGDNAAQIWEFCPTARFECIPAYEHNPVEHNFVVDTLEGENLHGRVGDWLIKGVAGEFCPCKPEIFAATYEPAGDALIDAKVELAERAVLSEG